MKDAFFDIETFVGDEADPTIGEAQEAADNSQEDQDEDPATSAEEKARIWRLAGLKPEDFGEPAEEGPAPANEKLETGTAVEKYARTMPASRPAGAGPGGQWTDEEERKHPRGKGDKGGQFVSKGQGGTGTVKPAAAGKGSQPQKPSGKVSIGGRGFEILRKAKDWFFRTAPDAPWSKAQPAAAAAIEAQADPEAAAYRKLQARHEQARWGDVPVRRQAHRKVKGIVARLVEQIVEAMHGQADHPDAALEAREAAWREQLNRKWLPLLQQTRGAYRQARREVRVTEQQLRRTPKYLEEVEDPETGEVLPRQALEARQKQARQAARAKQREDKGKWHHERRQAWQKQQKAWADAREARQAEQAKKRAQREAARQKKEEDAAAKEAEKSAAEKLKEQMAAQLKQQQRAKLQADAERRAEEQRQADERKQEESEVRKQQEAQGNQAAEQMAAEFGVPPGEIRKQAVALRPVFGTSTGTNLTLPEWHDPRVLARTREVLAKQKGQETPRTDEVRERLDREQREEAERQARRNAPAVSAHGVEYPGRVWEAAQQKLDAGQSLEVSDGNDIWEIRPKDRDNLRQGRDGNLQVQRRGRWIELGDAGLEILGSSAGVEPDYGPGANDEPGEDGPSQGGEDGFPWEKEEFARPGPKQPYARRQGGVFPGPIKEGPAG